MRSAVPWLRLGSNGAPPGCRRGSNAVVHPEQRLAVLGVRAAQFWRYPTRSAPARRAEPARAGTRTPPGHPVGAPGPAVPLPADVDPLGAGDRLHDPVSRPVRAATAGA